MELKPILESLLFSSQKPLTAAELRKIITATADASAAEPNQWKKVKLATINDALEALREDHETSDHSFRLICVAGAWQFVTHPEFVPWIRTLVGEKPRPPRLSQPALETLAIMAYRQPVTRAEMEQIRGVSVDGVVQTLLDRGLIRQMGRAEVVGRPMTYGTTDLFLEYFGLQSTEDLPNADELRRIPVEKPAALQTVDPGLTTAPPDNLGEEDESQNTTSADPSTEAPPQMVDSIPAEPSNNSAPGESMTESEQPSDSNEPERSS